MASIAGRPERIRPLAGCTPLSLIERWQAVLEAEWTEAFGCPPVSGKGCYPGGTAARDRARDPGHAADAAREGVAREEPPGRRGHRRAHPREPRALHRVRGQPPALVRVRDRIRVEPYLKSLTLTRSTARRHHRPTARRTLKPQGAHGRSGGSAQTTTWGRATSRPTTAPLASTAAASGTARALARARASEGSGTNATSPPREAPNGTRSGCGCWRWRGTEGTCSTRRVRASCAGSSGSWSPPCATQRPQLWRSRRGSSSPSRARSS